MMPTMQDELTKTIGAELGVGDLPPEEQEKLIAGFGEVALKAATIAVLEKLPEGKREEFAALAEAGDSTAVSVFLDREMPGHEQIASVAVAEELKRFKDSQSA
ncbi:MAG: DUF5663 domain-containing protein [bacterium]|nr:DUF5663 domain-containing protein [bacterium]